MDTINVVAALLWSIPAWFFFFARRREDWLGTFAVLALPLSLIVGAIELSVLGIIPLIYGLLLSIPGALVLCLARGNWLTRLVIGALLMALWPFLLYLGWLLFTPPPSN